MNFHLICVGPVKILRFTREKYSAYTRGHDSAEMRACASKQLAPRALVAMKLTDEVFRSFRVAKVFRENTDRVNCLDFSSNGDQMIASSNDDSIVIYCCLEGRCALSRITRRDIF